MDGDDQDAEARAAAQAEAERRERRKVIAVNKLGDAAQQVRRQFITEKLTSAEKENPTQGCGDLRRDLPDPRYLVDQRVPRSAQAAALLGFDGRGSLSKLVTDLPPTGDGRAQVITLGLVLGALEARTPKDAWRYGGGGGYGQFVKPSDYLQFLADNGYELAEVERVIVGERTGDEVYDETLSSAPDTDPEESDDAADDPEREQEQ